MPIFRYTALSLGGRKTAGIIEADSFEVAKEKLRKQKIMVTRLKLDKLAKKTPVLSSSLLLSFTRDITGLLKAGLPLYESLLAIEEKYRGIKSHALFLKLCEAVKQGKSLSAAMNEYPKSFDQVYVAMVSAGEETGKLPPVFDQLSKLITRSEKIKKQITTAMIYPAFLISFCLIVLVSLFFFLIPSMEELFEGRDIHSFTRSVLKISHFLSDHGLLFFLSFSASITSIVFFLRTHVGQLFRKRLSLVIPFIKNLVAEAVLSRFCRVLSVLLKSGVPLLNALPISRKVMNHPSFEEVILKAEHKLIEGKPLSTELKNSPLMPKLMIRMLSISEETGDVSTMLLNIAEIYEENLEKSLTRFSNILQPVILLILGLIVGIILLSVLLPLTDVSSFIQ